MSGKLPIDRVREAEDAPRVYEDHKQRFAEERAKLRDLCSMPANHETTSGEDVTAGCDDA